MEIDEKSINGCHLIGLSRKLENTIKASTERKPTAEALRKSQKLKRWLKPNN